jgi:hypothetical protein
MALEHSADLLRAQAAAQPDRSSLEQENARLKAEIASLKAQLEQFIEPWDTVDADALRALVYLSEHGRGVAAEISRACAMHVDVVQSQLNYLAGARYVEPAAGTAGYCLTPKGGRYLRNRGMA